MFPEETHPKIVRELDAIEAELFGLYRRVERIRLGLQRQWRVLADGRKWTEESHGATVYSGERRNDVAQDAASSKA